MRDITKLSGYPRSNVKTRLEQSNLFLASGRFPLQNAIYDNKLPDVTQSTDVTSSYKGNGSLSNKLFIRTSPIVKYVYSMCDFLSETLKGVVVLV